DIITAIRGHLFFIPSIHATAPGLTATSALNSLILRTVTERHCCISLETQTLIVLPIRSGNKENPGKL
ncbi:TPA: hypothetical protein ACNEZI_002739, partial [Escherichia coli]